MSTRKSTILHPIIMLICAAAYLALFADLDKAPLLQWDESRRGVNAAEMMEQDSWLVPYFEGKPDHWATKPSLLVAVQRLSFELFGISEWSLRFPVALFGCFTILVVGIFSQYINKNRYSTYLAMFIILATPGYMHYHIVFTGDYDGLLLFFMCLSNFGFFAAVESPKVPHRRVGWALFGLGLALGTLTKGVAAWLYLPAIPLYLWYRKKWIETLKTPASWITITLALLVISAYYLGRESIDPGYLKAVYDNELGGRYLDTLEGHKHPWHIYIRMFFEKKFLPWYLLIPFAFVGPRTAFQKNATIWLSLSALVQMVVVSNSSTKLPYYEAAIYPWLSILAAMGAWQVLNRFILNPLTIGHFKLNTDNTRVLAFLAVWLLSFIFIFPHKKHQLEMREDTKIGAFIRQLEPYDHYFICHHGYSAHNIFYVKKLQSEGKDVTLNAIDYLQPGDSIALCEKDHWRRLHKNFEFELIHGQVDQCALVGIDKKKQGE